MKHLKLFILFTTVLLLSGCEKELDVENVNQPTVDVFWKTESNAVSGVNAVYSTLHRLSISRWLPFFYIIRSDEGKSMSVATDLVNNMDRFFITDYNYAAAYGVWNDNYIGIYRANQVLANVPAIEMDEALKQRVLGEAKFLRALFYYHLVTLWGNVPLNLEPSALGATPTAATTSQVWAQIEIDLNEAAQSLPLSYANDADLGRVTKGAAYALLAKAYMQQGKYPEAITPLTWLVEGEGASVYDLMEDYRDNFLITSENNKESVFEWQFQRNASENHDDDTAPQPDNQNYGASIPKFFAPPDVGFSDGEANRWLIAEYLRDTTIEGTRDPRLEASLLFDSTDVGGPDATLIYGTSFTARFGKDNKRVWFRKFLNDHWKNTEEFNSPNNWRYIRYADVLLMYAEALNANGNTTAAYAFVNRVRNRAGLPDLENTTMTQPEFLEQIKHERIVELAGEGHRWNDLARWGDLGSEQVKQRDPGFANFVKNKHELLPVPQQERDINPALGQNTNW